MKKEEEKNEYLEDESRRLRLESRNVNIEIQRKEYDDQVRSCCSRVGTTDKRLINASFKMFVISVVLIFSLTNIGINSITDDGCNHFNAFFMSLVTLIVGMFLDKPEVKKLKEQS